MILRNWTHRSSRLVEGSGLTLAAEVHHCRPSSDYHRGAHCSRLAGIYPQSSEANSGGHHPAICGKRMKISQSHRKIQYFNMLRSTHPVGHDHTGRFLNLGIEPSPERNAIASFELNGLASEGHCYKTLIVQGASRKWRLPSWLFANDK